MSDPNTVHTVALELLRHGPPHSHLLSTATSYLAVCGHHQAETVHLPFDHLEYENSMAALNYHTQDATRRRAMLEQLSGALGRLLGSVRGLVAGLGSASDGDHRLVELRLVMTPHELALLPFECAFADRGIPSSTGQPIAVHPRVEVAVTRHVRSAIQDQHEWPTEPRVLFAWASRPRSAPVPFARHLLHLRRAVDAWIPRERDLREATKPRTTVQRVRDVVTVLPEATIEDIERACTRQSFTHVHILAHGVPHQAIGEQRQIGISLRDRGREDSELVDGDRLASALRGSDRRGKLPSMVTLAACDTGRVASLVTHGGSLAHQLHLAGIPVVVASQFPLSIPGSILLTDTLYYQVFRGVDVRAAVHDARRRLHASLPHYHDWASLVTYVALPDDYTRQAKNLQFETARREIDNGLDDLDVEIVRAARSDTTRGDAQNPAGEEFAEGPALESLNIQDVHARVDVMRAKAERLAQLRPNDVHSMGLRASVAKRCAQLLWHVSKALSPSVKDRSESRRRLNLNSLDLLGTACQLYERAMYADLGETWTGVQFLSLTTILHFAGRAESLPEKHIRQLMRDVCRARLGEPRSSIQAREHESPDSAQAWAHAGLLELELIDAIVANESSKQDRNSAKKSKQIDAHIDAARQHAAKIIELCGVRSFHVYSTHRQLERYVDWWQAEDFGNYDPTPAERVAQVFDSALGMASAAHPDE